MSRLLALLSIASNFTARPLHYEQKKKRNHCYLLEQIYIKLTLNPSNKLEIKLVMGISIEWCKTQTKETTMTNQSKGNHHNKPIRIQI